MLGYLINIYNYYFSYDNYIETIPPEVKDNKTKLLNELMTKFDSKNDENDQKKKFN